MPKPSLLALSLVLFSAACGAATTSPSEPAPSASPEAGKPTAAEVSASPAASAALTATPSAPPPAPAVLAADSSPPGIHPLAEDEKKELATQCKKLQDAITKSARKDAGKRRSDEIVAQFLANPPKIAGVDVPRCGDLMLRDLRAYLARTRENGAVVGLKMIVVGLSRAIEDKPGQLCPSAPAVPADLASLATAPQKTESSDWKAAGWTCAHFDRAGSMEMFQYELKTDQKTGHYEAIARGFPVPGEKATELFLAGDVKDGKIEPSSAVMRRAAP